MARLLFILVPVAIAFWIYSIVDCALQPPTRHRGVSKPAWMLIVIILPVLGGVLWFAIGREYARPVNLGGFGDPRRREADAPATSLEPLTPGSFGVRNTEAELAALDREIEAYEKAERIRQLEEQLRERRREKGIEG